MRWLKSQISCSRESSFSCHKETYLCVGATPQSVSDQDEFGMLFREVFKKNTSLRYRHLVQLIWWCVCEAGSDTCDHIWNRREESRYEEHGQHTYLSVYLSIYLSTYLPIYLSTYLPVYLPIYLSTYLPIYLSIYRSIYLCIHPSIHPSIHLSMYSFIHLSIYPSIHLSIYPSIHLSLYLSIYLPIYLSLYLSIYLSIIYLSISILF